MKLCTVIIQLDEPKNKPFGEVPLSVYLSIRYPEFNYWEIVSMLTAETKLLATKLLSDTEYTNFKFYLFLDETGVSDIIAQYDNVKATSGLGDFFKNISFSDIEESDAIALYDSTVFEENEVLDSKESFDPRFVVGP